MLRRRVGAPAGPDSTDGETTRAAGSPLGPGTLGRVVGGDVVLAARAAASDTGRMVAGSPVPVIGLRTPATGAIRRITGGAEIAPATRSALRSSTPRLAVMPLPLRTAGAASSSHRPGNAPAASGPAWAGGSAVVGAASGGTAPGGTAPGRTTSGREPGTTDGRGAAAPLAIGAGRTSAAAGTAIRRAMAMNPVTVPGVAGPPVPAVAAAAQRTGTQALPSGSVAAADRETPVAGHPAPSEIRPGTVTLLRSARVAPPRGLPSAPAPRAGTGARPVTAASGAAAPRTARPTPPASSSDVDIRRSLASVAGGGDTAASTAAPSGSLIGRVPPSLFDRARAELRSAAAGSTAGAGVIRRVGAELATAPANAPARSSSTEQLEVRHSLTSREWDQLVDEVVRRIESRVTAELARRGRRFTPRTM
jgi:hypothetical protein